MITVKDFISHNGELYLIQRVVREADCPSVEDWKQYLKADLVLRKAELLYFVQAVPEAEILDPSIEEPLKPKNDNMKLNPLNGYVIVKPIEAEEETRGAIVIPDLGKERPEAGIVLAAAPTFNFHANAYIDDTVKVGDTVLIPKLGAAKVTVDGSDYYIIKATDLYAVVVNEDLKTEE